LVRPFPADVEMAGLLEIGELFPLAALVVAALCDAGDPLAGALLNGFMAKSSTETIASPTSNSTE
jgi:hypothetical protein